jgi:hypothetical protein
MDWVGPSFTARVYDRIRRSTRLQKGQDTQSRYIPFNYKQTLETMKKEPGSSAARYAVDAQILSSLRVYNWVFDSRKFRLHSRLNVAPFLEVSR